MEKSSNIEKVLRKNILIDFLLNRWIKIMVYKRRAINTFLEREDYQMLTISNPIDENNDIQFINKVINNE